jgi:hypothetical protein
MSSAPVLVVAAPFCGSSLLAQMLGSHPEACAAPALNLALADTVDEWLAMAALAQAPLADGLLRFVAEHWGGGQDAQGIRYAQDWLQQRRGLRMEALTAELRARVAPRALVIPDADAALRPEALLRWQRLLPDARWVLPLRHPMTHGAVYAAWLAEQLYLPPDVLDGSRTPEPGRIDPQIPWLRCRHNLARWVSASVQQRLRMEDLAADPASTLRHLCEALGWAVPDAAGLARLLQAEGSAFAGQGPPEAPFGLEPEVLDEVLEGLELPAPPPSLRAAAPWCERGALDPAVIEQAEADGYR